jgi:hypothetical protein
MSVVSVEIGNPLVARALLFFVHTSHTLSFPFRTVIFRSFSSSPTHEYWSNAHSKRRRYSSAGGTPSLVVHCLIFLLTLFHADADAFHPSHVLLSSAEFKMRGEYCSWMRGSQVDSTSGQFSLSKSPAFLKEVLVVVRVDGVRATPAHASPRQTFVVNKGFRAWGSGRSVGRRVGKDCT